MKIKRKRIIGVLLTFALYLGIVGCGKSSENTSNESKVDLATVLKYKDSYVGDNSAVLNIVNNLPANIYNEGIELQTTSEPYEITIKYKEFKDVSIKFDDDSVSKLSFEEVLKDNALIMFSLVQNVDIVNFKIDSGDVITYKKADLVKDYKDYYGNEFTEVLKDKASLESLIKNKQKDV